MKMMCEENGLAWHVLRTTAKRAIDGLMSPVDIWPLDN